MPFDLKTFVAGHHAFFHGRQVITHKPVNPTGPDCATAYGVKDAATRRALSAFGEGLTLESVENIWEVYETDRPVNNGDLLIEADGTTHIVVSRFWSDLSSRSSCATRVLNGGT